MNIFQNYSQLSKQKGHVYHINYENQNDFFFAWRVTNIQQDEE